MGRTSKNTAAEFTQRCSDAEKEVVKVASKMQETTTSLVKYRRDRDCKLLTANDMFYWFLFQSSLKGRWSHPSAYHCHTRDVDQRRPPLAVVLKTTFCVQRFWWNWCKLFLGYSTTFVLLMRFRIFLFSR